MEAAAWGLLGTLVGAMASIATAWMASRSSNRIQSEKHAEERAERAKEFQRETLLALQEAIHDALRLNARAHFEDVASFRKTGRWGRELLSDEVNDGLILSRRKVAILIERVVDASLRTDVKSLMRVAAKGGFAQSEQEAEMNLFELSERMTPLLENIGSVLRSHY
jgi:hypothetical protein